MNDTPVVPPVFPNWARLALGLLVGLASVFVTSDFIRIGENERLLISSVVIVLGSAGIVPPSPSSFRMSPAVSIALSLLALLLNYLIVAVFVDDLTVQGILAGLVAFAATVGIVPPQVPRR